MRENPSGRIELTFSQDRMNNMELRMRKKKEENILNILVDYFGKASAVSVENLLSFLKQRAPIESELNNSQFTELIKTIPKNEMGQIALKDFVFYYLNEERKQEQIIEEISNTIIEHQKMRKSTFFKLNAVRETEKLNNEDIMMDSVLCITIDHASRSFSNFKEPLFIRVSTDQGASVDSPVFRLDEELHIEEEMQIPIISKNEKISMELIEFSEGVEFKLGEGFVFLDRLKDQKKHEDSVEMKDIGESVIGEIFVVLQWIYSRGKFLQDVIRKWDETLKEKEDELRSREERLEDLRLPFKQIIEGIVLQVNFDTFNTHPHKMFQQHFNVHYWALVVWYILGALGVLQMLTKEDFNSLVIAISGVVLLYSQQPVSSTSLLMHLIAIPASICWDILWIFTYGAQWGQWNFNFDTLSPKLVTGLSRYISYYTTITLAFSKFAMFFVQFYLYRNNETIPDFSSSMQQFINTVDSS